MPEALDHSASVVQDNRIWLTSGRCRGVVLTVSQLSCHAICVCVNMRRNISACTPPQPAVAAAMLSAN